MNVFDDVNTEQNTTTRLIAVQIARKAIVQTSMHGSAVGVLFKLHLF